MNSSLSLRIVVLMVGMKNISKFVLKKIRFGGVRLPSMQNISNFILHLRGFLSVGS